MTGKVWARRSALGAMAGAAVLLAGCNKTSSNSLRYKMTVEVETPQGLKSGFAVREMTLATNNIMRPANGRIKGEAVVVDLPGGQALFALLTGGDGDVDYAMQIGGRAQVWGKSAGEPPAGPVELYPTAPKTTGLQNTNPLPMLVRFRDITDPKSVEAVDPEAIGVKRIMVETTSDDVTVGIGGRLPSFGSQTGFDSWYANLQMNDPRRVTLNDFTTEIR